jgi:Protein of unknown function (DUF998)
MSERIATPAAGSPGASAGTTRRVTGALLACAAAAGPLYLVAGLAQAFTRPGFDITRHDLSVLSNGDLGWIQIANFLVSGGLVVAGAVGMRRALRSGRARTWGPLLVGVYGLGLIGAAFFVADPALGFPPGTPAGARAVSWHGLMHFVSGGVGFLSLIAACFVFARRFAGLELRGWAVYSVLTGVLFLAGFFGIAAGSGNSWTILGFWIAVTIAWAWITALALRLMRELSAAAA